MEQARLICFRHSSPDLVVRSDGKSTQGKGVVMTLYNFSTRVEKRSERFSLMIRENSPPIPQSTAHFDESGGGHPAINARIRESRLAKLFN
jgi:hypothetical protein